MQEQIDRSVKLISNILFAIGLAALAGIMFLTVADVLGRYLGHSIIGAYQVSEIMELWMICLAWPFAEAIDVHIRMDVVVSRFSKRAQNKIDIFTYILTLGVFCLIAWQGFELVKRNFELGELVGIIGIPLSPFQVVIFIGAGANCLVLFSKLLKLFTYLRKSE